MKKTLLFWLSAVAAHTYLFYNQEQGYNTTVFALILVALVGLNQGQLFFSASWWLGGGVQVLNAIAVSYHATSWLQAMYVCSLFIFIGLTYAPRSSLYVAWFNGLFAAVFVGFITQLSHFKKEIITIYQPFSGRFFRTKPSLYVMPFSITAGFYLLYCWANPDFRIDFSFVEAEVDFLLIGFIFFGLVWLCPLFFPWGDNTMVTLEAQWSNSLIRTRQVRHGVSTLALKRENQQGVILFLMLNLLISAFLGFNLLQLFIPGLQSQPKGFSDQVHEGFNALIISILMAIVLIIYYFRANQNDYLTVFVDWQKNSSLDYGKDKALRRITEFTIFRST